LVTRPRQVAQTPALQAKGCGETGEAGAVQDVAGLGVERDAAGAAVERHLHGEAGGLRLQLLHLRGERCGRAAGGEAFDQDAVRRHADCGQRFLGGVHHRAGAADEEGADLLRLDERAQDEVALGAVEHAVEQLDLLGFLGEEMVDLEPVMKRFLSEASSSRKITDWLSRLP
jgi:hypothetical protein